MGDIVTMMPCHKHMIGSHDHTREVIQTASTNNDNPGNRHPKGEGAAGPTRRGEQHG